jgi:beta-glucosidase
VAQRLTIRDIAQLAGVSPATVSRVLNQKPDVEAATRERILAIIAESGYAPDPTATVLASTPRRRHTLPTQRFPANFLWGVATSAFQIEGALDEDERGPSIWDSYVAYPPPDFTAHTAAIACDHYHRMPEDVALLAQLGVNSYRFSVSWPRVLPEGEGAINAPGLDFYDRLVDQLLAADIAPMVTLYHWDLPLALQQRYGGWLDRRTALAFAEFAEAVARRLGDRVPWWATLNEPWTVTVFGYLLGKHPPHQQDAAQALQVAHHLLLAHGLALPRIRQWGTPEASVGIALNLMPVYPADQREATQGAAHAADLWYNRWFLDPLFRGAYPEAIQRELDARAIAVTPDDLRAIAAPLDFLGVNYYSRLVVRPATTVATGPLTGYSQVVPVPEASYSRMGWETFATGLRDMLVRIYRDYQPPAILVTENGAAFDDTAARAGWQIQDRRRIAFLQEHIEAMQTAFQLGVPLRGYYAWTLFDNFEWTDGYDQRFGLMAIDRLTQSRYLKESGRWYAHFIATQRERLE